MVVLDLVWLAGSTVVRGGIWLGQWVTGTLPVDADTRMEAMDERTAEMQHEIEQLRAIVRGLAERPVSPLDDPARTSPASF